MSKTVLLATEKAFSASARDQVVAIIKEAGYTANVLENYKGKGPLIEAIASADAVIFRSDIIEGVGGNQILVEDPSGNPVELFEPTRPEASLASS